MPHRHLAQWYQGTTAPYRPYFCNKIRARVFGRAREAGRPMSKQRREQKLRKAKVSEGALNYLVSSHTQKSSTH